LSEKKVEAIRLHQGEMLFFFKLFFVRKNIDLTFLGEIISIPGCGERLG